MEVFHSDPVVGKSQFMDWRPQPMRKVHLLVPFATLRVGAPPDDDNGVNDEDIQAADTKIVARYHVHDAESAAPIIAAAETLGFHCIYNSGDPEFKDPDMLGVVTLLVFGRSEQG